jgi:hypothetical protein
VSDLKDRQDLARSVFASLDGFEASALRMLSLGLSFADGPVGRFATAIGYYADYVEHEYVQGPRLAVVKMAYDLHMATFEPGCTSLLKSLKRVDVPPWPAIRAALITLRENETAAA